MTVRRAIELVLVAILMSSCAYVRPSLLVAADARSPRSVQQLVTQFLDDVDRMEWINGQMLPHSRSQALLKRLGPLSVPEVLRHARLVKADRCPCRDYQRLIALTSMLVTLPGASQGGLLLELSKDGTFDLFSRIGAATRARELGMPAPDPLMLLDEAREASNAK